MSQSGGEDSNPERGKQIASSSSLLLTTSYLAIVLSHTTQASNASLSNLVSSVVNRELRDCHLVVAWDMQLKGSNVVAAATTFPNVKQVFLFSVTMSR